MALQRVFWSGGNDFDIHVVRGTTSRRLDDLLAITDTNGTSFFANALPAGGGYAVQFTGLFAGAPAAHGVSVAAATGAVTATAGPPARKLRNFIVLATVTQGANVGTAKIRFHIHESVTDIWATPASLTVRRNAEAVRLTVLARFDDGVIGDVTEWSRLPAGHASLLTWRADRPADVDVQADGTLVAKQIGVPRNVNVTIGPLPAPGNLMSTVPITVTDPWTRATALTFVDGAGAARFASVPNILFLPDGFTAQADFETLAREAIREIRLGQVTRPFDLVKDSVNFWMAWVPSVQDGAGALPEMGKVLAQSGAIRRAVEVPYPQAPPGAAATWTLNQMIHEVGLPVAADAGRPLTGGARAMLPELQTLFGAKVTQARIQAAYPEWLKLASRTLLNERNTTFGLVTGERPRFLEQRPHRVLARHPHRLSNADFDRFLNSLTHAVGAVGAGWVFGDSVAGLAAGKDRGLVAILSLCRRFSGGNAQRVQASSIGNAVDVRYAVAPPGADPTTLAPIPTKIEAETHARIVHEFAHAPVFGLKDEYGGTPALPAGTTFPNHGNVQEEPAVRIGGALVPANIKWQWHRIEAAGVTTAQPVPVPGQPPPPRRFTIQLGPKHAAVFAVRDRVRLRTRPLLGSTVSHPLEVTAVNVATDLVTVDAGAGGLAAATFKAGSVLYRPKRAAAPPHDELSLVAPRILAHIAGSNNPLNAVAGAAAGAACTPDAKLMLPATNIPAAIRAQIAATKRPRWSAWLVGLYEGGALFSCGVYHPTGTCLMRSLEFPNTGGNLSVYQFCTVCRYVLADVLDPSKHGAIDADYDPRYPDP